MRRILIKIWQLCSGIVLFCCIFLPLAQASQSVEARYLQIILPGDERILSLAEVEVYNEEKLISLDGRAMQLSTYDDASASRANDGDTSGAHTDKSIAHTHAGNDVWWELDLGANQEITRIALYNRTDCCGERINPAKLLLLSDSGRIVWQGAISSNKPRYDFLIKEKFKQLLKASPNLLRNATFRQRTNVTIPDFWDLHHASALKFKNLYDLYYVDESIESPVEGTDVLVMHNSEKYFQYFALMPRSLFSALPRGEYTFSVFVKANRPGLEFNVTPGWMKGRAETRKLSTAWKRYSFKYTLLDSGLDALQPILRFPKKGTYYIAAPQLEKGAFPTVFQPAYEDTASRNPTVRDLGIVRIPRETKLDNAEVLLSSFEYDYYTRDDFARILLTSGYKSKLIVNVQCKNSVGEPAPFTGLDNIELRPFVSTSINIPIHSLPKGEYACYVSAFDHGTKLAGVMTKLRKIASRQIEVRYNKDRRSFFINNKPFFIIGVGGLSGTLPDWYLADLKAHEINTLFYKCPHNRVYEACVKEIKALLGKASKHGFKVIIGSPVAGPKPARWRQRLSEFYRLIKQFKDNKSIIGWYTVDEPRADTWSDEELIEIYENVRRIDPYRLVFVNWGVNGVPSVIGQQPRGTLSSTDIYSIDYYPFAGRGHTLKGFTQTTVKALETARLYKKASHSWLQLYGGMNAWREPTAVELKYMAYLNYVYGGMISYWDTKSNSARNWESISRINLEGKELANKLFHDADAHEIFRPVFDKNFVYSIWKKNNSVFMIVVHAGSAEEEFSYNVSKLLNKHRLLKVQSIFEHREIKLINGNIVEKFPAFEARVFEIFEE